MSTQLFFRNVVADIFGPGSPLTQFNNTDQIKTLSTARGASAVTLTNTTLAGGTRGFGRFVSPPLAAAATISGTVTVNLREAEAAMTSNVGAVISVWVAPAIADSLDANYNNTTATPWTILVSSADGVEMGTSESALNWTPTPISRTLSKGDRICVVPGFGPVGTESTNDTITFWLDGPTDAASGDSYITFAETLTFDTATPAGTQVYLTDTASDIDPGADDERTLDFSRGASPSSASKVVAAGPIAKQQLQRSATNVRWYTPALGAATISGPIAISLRVSDSTASNNATLGLKLIKRTSGGTETDIAYGLLNLASLDTSETTRTMILGCDDISIADNDRLCVVAYTDDGYSGNILISTPTLAYNGSAGGNGDSWLQFSSTFGAPAAAKPPYRNPYLQLLAH